MPSPGKETASADDSSTLPEPACYKPRPMHRAKHSDVTAPARFAGLALIALSTLGLAALGCESGGVGDPCIPEDEFFDTFSGFSLEEVNVESRSYQCETRVCLVNKFQGRVSCPYGTNGTMADSTADTVRHNLPCEIPSFGGYTTVPVEPQLTARSPDVSVYCSCRCGGNDPNARYCECPSGFECLEIVVSRDDQEQAELAGSYCVRTNTNVDPATVPGDQCRLPPNGQAPGPNEATCGTPPDPPG